MELYKLTEEYKKAIDELLEMAVVTEEYFKETLDALEGEIKQKAIAVGVYITGLENEQKDLVRQENAITIKRKKVDASINKLKSYLLRHLIEYIHLNNELIIK